MIVGVLGKQSSGRSTCKCSQSFEQYLVSKREDTGRTGERRTLSRT
jgi:hypothetical protein